MGLCAAAVTAAGNVKYLHKKGLLKKGRIIS